MTQAPTPQKLASLEVQLQWSDFAWALENLRHRPYSKKMTDRDWFRINPLEILLLGANSLIGNDKAKRDHVTMVLVMENILPHMLARPRFWKRLLLVLTAVCSSAPPPLVLQRCCAAFVGLWQTIKGIPEIYTSCIGWIFDERNIIDLLDHLCSELSKSPGILSSVENLLNEFKDLQCAAGEYSQQYLGSQVTHSTFHSQLLEPFIGCEGGTPKSVGAQMLSLSSEVEFLSTDHNLLSSVLLLTQDLQKSATSLVGSTHELLALIHLMVARLRAQNEQNLQEQVPKSEQIASNGTATTGSDQHDASQNTGQDADHGVHQDADQGVHQDADQGVHQDADQGVHQDVDQGVHQDVQNKLTPQEGRTLTKQSSTSVMLELFSALSDAIRKWVELSKAFPNRTHSDVPTKLVVLAEVIVASNSISIALPEAVGFFRSPINILMSYATEGYLSDAPHEFMSELLEYVSSLVEQGTPLTSVLNSRLPNLFGPIFGIRSHTISCKLLEYGYLAAGSRQQKSLLTEGLTHMMGVYRLFTPIDEIRAQQKHIARHALALKHCTSILDELIQSLPLGDEEEQSGTENSDSVKCPTSPTFDAAELPDVTDEEGREDREARLEILHGLLQLACVMIGVGDNVSYLFASVLPKLLRDCPPTHLPEGCSKAKVVKVLGEEPPPTLTWVDWKVDRKKLALTCLQLCTVSVMKNMCTPFELCGVVVPKLVRNLDEMELSDNEKLSLLIDILKITHEHIETGLDISQLVSHGLDLLTLLHPKPEELRDFIDHMFKQVMTSDQGSVLFLIKHSCQYMKVQFPDDSAHIQTLFRAMVYSGKREAIRNMFKICRHPFKEEPLASFRHYLYQYTQGLNHKQFISLCEILVMVMDLLKEKEGGDVGVAEGEGEHGEAKMRQEKERLKKVAVMRNLIEPCLSGVKAALKEKKFKKEVWEDAAAQLQKAALFRTLFQSELATLSNLSSDELQSIFSRKFPPDVLCSADTMELLSLCSTRMEHMRTPQYDSLRTVLSQLLNHFLTLELEPQLQREASDTQPNKSTTVANSALTSSPSEHNLEPSSPTPAPSTATQSTPAPTPLEQRKRLLEAYVASMPRNVEDEQLLKGCGYSSKLWEQGIVLTVKTDGSHSLEENMRQTLLACYREFSDILKQLNITDVSVDGAMVKSSELFTEEQSLVELKGRRAIAVKAIDQKLGGARDGHYYEKRLALLSKEDEIEAEFEEKAKAPITPRTFTVRLNTSFFDCARCCGAHIVGCYAPNGEHCERPLEIGLRKDSAFVSIYDETGLEIENLEILFTHEGAYTFKAYSNGHPYDTSQVWLTFFQSLLTEPCMVPAIIVPKSYPNERTWEALQKCLSPVVTGSILTCRHDFSSEWRSYYDHRPEKVRIGTDMILHPGFKVGVKPTLLRQRSRLTTDLAGMIFESVFQQLLEDDTMNQFRFLGKLVSQYISAYIQDGVRRVQIIEGGFDYERWKKRRQPLPPVLLLKGDPPPKEDIIGYIVQRVDGGVVKWCAEVDLKELCINSHKQLMEMKVFLEKVTERNTDVALKTKLKLLRSTLEQCMHIVPIGSLPDALQVEVMHWVFRNEDRVWRHRGGRDGHETLQQFMSFLGQKTPVDNSVPEDSRKEVLQFRKPTVYPGIGVFCVPQTLDHTTDHEATYQVQQLVSYAVGEVIAPVGVEDENAGDQEGNRERWRPFHDDCYEVVTAWVHPNYRGLNLAVQMYLKVAMQAPAKLVMCDMLVGSVERIIGSNWLLWILDRTKLMRLIIRWRQPSYLVVTQRGETEQFEQVVLSVKPLRVALKARQAAGWIRVHPIGVTAAIAGTALAIPVFVTLLRYIQVS